MERDLIQIDQQINRPTKIFEERDFEIERLRFEEGWKLQKIADKYDITRERVRQIVGNTGYLFAQLRHEEIKDADPMESNQALAKRLNMKTSTISLHRDGWHTVEGDSVLAMGNGWEKWAAVQMIKRGHVAELQPLRSYFDILLDTHLKVDVKAATGNIPPSKQGRQKNPGYHFNLRKSEARKPVDFYFCIATETEDVFIVPYDKLPMPKETLLFCWPTARPTLGKYQKYHNRWDLLNGDTQ